jgi:hypothetical protein
VGVRRAGDGVVAQRGHSPVGGGHSDQAAQAVVAVEQLLAVGIDDAGLQAVGVEVGLGAVGGGVGVTAVGVLDQGAEVLGRAGEAAAAGEEAAMRKGVSFLTADRRRCLLVKINFCEGAVWKKAAAIWKPAPRTAQAAILLAPCLRRPGRQ